MTGNPITVAIQTITTAIVTNGKGAITASILSITLLAMMSAVTFVYTSSQNASNITNGSVPISNLPVGTSSGTIASGNDSRIVNAVQINSSTSLKEISGVVYAAPFLTDTTCATDQTANIAAADSATPSGGTLIFPPGCISHSGTIINNGHRWEGTGIAYSDNLSSISWKGGTQLSYTSSIGVALKIIGNAAGIDHIRQSTTQLFSNAVGLQMSDGINNPQSQFIEHYSSLGFQTQIDIQSGQFWHINSCDLHNASLYAIRIRNLVTSDSGDGNIYACNIYADAPIGSAGIRYESGGGLKLTGIKILQFQRSFDLQIADGANTSDLLIDNSNSFENPLSGQSVRLGQLGPSNTGIFHNIVIKAQIHQGQVTTLPGVENVTIGGVYSNTNVGITLNGGSNISVSDETVCDIATVACVVIADPTINASIGHIQCLMCLNDISDTRTIGAGPVSRQGVRPVNIPQSASYTYLYSVALQPYRGVRISLLLEGVIQSVGNSLVAQDILASIDGAGIVTTSVVSNTTVGFTANIQLDTTSIPGTIRIGIRPDAGVGGANYQGSLTINVIGKSSNFSNL